LGKEGGKKVIDKENRGGGVGKEGGEGEDHGGLEKQRHRVKTQRKFVKMLFGLLNSLLWTVAISQVFCFDEWKLPQSAGQGRKGRRIGGGFTFLGPRGFRRTSTKRTYPQDRANAIGTR